jgi:hypothetical protein
LEDLKKLGLYDDSTIIVTSDHGNMFGEWGRYNHQDCLQYPNVFVPFIIKYAKSDEEKKINPDRIFQQTDVFAEILELYGIAIPPYSYGIPFEAKEGNQVINQLYYFKYFVGEVKKILGRDLCGTILNFGGNYYQLIYSTNGKHGLYRINEFMNTEMDNFYEEFKDNPQVAEFIRKSPALLKRRIFKDKPIDNQELIEKLKSLGYIK